MLYINYIKEDFTNIKCYEFDCGSEWTRTTCLDTCEFYRIFMLKFYSVRVSNTWNTFIKFILKINVNIYYILIFKVFKIYT